MGERNGDLRRSLVVTGNSHSGIRPLIARFNIWHGINRPTVERNIRNYSQDPNVMASTSTAHSSSPAVGTTMAPSRLDRLFILLATSSTSATRTLAARQLAELVKMHPRELDSILQHLHPLLRSRQWETRIAAADAITEVLGTLKFTASGDLSTTEREGCESGTTKGFLSLETFDLRSVLESRKEIMGASLGEEFELRVAIK